MGYNTVIVVMNDCLHHIREDVEFGKKLYDQVMLFNRPNERHDISSGMCVNAATVIGVQHADCTQVIAIGGNSGEIIANLWYESPHTEEGKVALVKAVADQLGYRLVKKNSSC